MLQVCVTAPPLFVTAPPLLLPHPPFFVRTPKLATVFCVSGVGFWGNGWGFCGAGRQWRWKNFDLHPPPRSRVLHGLAFGWSWVEAGKFSICTSPPGREFCTELLFTEARRKIAAPPILKSFARHCSQLFINCVINVCVCTNIVIML